MHQILAIIFCSIAIKQTDGNGDAYKDILEMDLGNKDVTDQRLQFIFEHMTNLVNLTLQFDLPNTNFGLTGRHGSLPGRVDENAEAWNEHLKRKVGSKAYERTFGTPCTDKTPSRGFSISRLKNLERLSLFGFSQMDDTIYEEFAFPKLRFLEFTAPRDSSLLPQLAFFMPSLESVRLFWQTNYEHLIDFCKNLKKLKTLSLRKTELGEDMTDDQIKRAFEACPTLTAIRGYNDSVNRTKYIAENTTHQQKNNIQFE